MEGLAHAPDSPAGVPGERPARCPGTPENPCSPPAAPVRSAHVRLRSARAPLPPTAWTADANEVSAPLLGLPCRPFAWVDDEITGLDQAWVARHHPGPALLHRLDPVAGLTAAGFAVLASWLRGPATR
ncbi:hypothetical protein ACF06N_03305 [Streptomyces albidoflavus]